MEIASLIISSFGLIFSIISLIVTLRIYNSLKISNKQTINENNGVAVNGQVKGKIYGNKE